MAERTGSGEQHARDRTARWLQPVHLAPRLLSRDAVVDAVASLEPEGAHDPVLALVDQRTALVVALVLSLELTRAAEFRAVEPWRARLPADVDGLATRSGVEAGACERALEQLERAGLIERTRESGSLLVGLTARAFEVDPAATHLDWGVVLDRLAGDAPALLVARAFARLLRVPDRWTRVRRASLDAFTLYSGGMVKRGLAAVVRQGVVEQTAAGGRYRSYRFTRAVLAGTDTADAPAVATTPSGREATAATARATAGLVVRMGGTQLRLPAGAELRVVGFDETGAAIVEIEQLPPR